MGTTKKLRAKKTPNAQEVGAAVMASDEEDTRSSSSADGAVEWQVYPVFIPSKGRAGKPGTWDHLTSSEIPFTVVVEPQEYTAYKAAFDGNAFASVARLPMNDQGVCYVRNHILEKLSPKSGWWWCIDDDIQVFKAALADNSNGAADGEDAAPAFNNRNKRVLASVDASTFFSLARPEEAALLVPGTCLVGVEYEQFAAAAVSSYLVDSYVNICFALNHSLLPRDADGKPLRYRFPVREDYDMCLQIMRHGGHTFRFRNVAFRAPQMGTRPGGMTDFYRTQLEEIRRCNDVMLREWGPEVCDERQKGSEQTGTLRWDLKVHWHRCASRPEILKPKPGGYPVASRKERAAMTSKANRTKGPKKRQRRRADDDFGSSTDEDDYDYDDGLDGLCLDDVTPHKVVAETKSVKAPPKPRAKVPKGWHGWTVMEVWAPDPKAFGLERMVRVKVGAMGCILHYSYGALGVMVCDVFNKSCVVVPDPTRGDVKEASLKVTRDEVFAVPKDGLAALYKKAPPQAPVDLGVIENFEEL